MSPRVRTRARSHAHEHSEHARTHARTHGVVAGTWYPCSHPPATALMLSGSSPSFMLGTAGDEGIVGMPAGLMSIIAGVFGARLSSCCGSPAPAAALTAGDAEVAARAAVFFLGICPGDGPASLKRLSDLRASCKMKPRDRRNLSCLRCDFLFADGGLPHCRAQRAGGRRGVAGCE
jgi:hypothetical protein